MITIVEFSWSIPTFHIELKDNTQIIYNVIEFKLGDALFIGEYDDNDVEKVVLDIMIRHVRGKNIKHLVDLGQLSSALINLVVIPVLLIQTALVLYYPLAHKEQLY